MVLQNINSLKPNTQDDSSAQEDCGSECSDGELLQAVDDLWATFAEQECPAIRAPSSSAYASRPPQLSEVYLNN